MIWAIAAILTIILAILHVAIPLTISWVWVLSPMIFAVALWTVVMFLLGVITCYAD
jgi:hypothetical protein